MMTSIQIHLGAKVLKAQLIDTPTSQAILQALPLEGKASVWGGEIYFQIPVDTGLEPGAKEILDPGDLAFWPTGSAFCIFFDKTPASCTNKPQAYSAVNIFGKMDSDLDSLYSIRDGDPIRVERSS